MKLKIFKLYFKTPCHFGERGLGLEKTSVILHSDSIFNALINAWAFLFRKENLEKFLVEECKEPSFLITSGFPFNKNVFYFPRIQWKFPAKEEVIEKKGRKKLKKLEFIKKDLFEKWINEKVVEREKISEALENLDFIKEDLIPKNQLSRINSSFKQLYSLGVIKFKKNAGIWFGIEEKKEGVIKDWIIPALKFLQDQGIGAKRTWGLGKFEFEEKEIEIKTPEKSEKFVNLSVVFPKENDLSLIKNTFIKNTSWFRWHLITRGGYPVYSPFAESFSLRKPLIKMIGEGSVLPEIKGNILKIPENEEILRKINFPHFVYHYGRGFLIPAKLKENYE